MMFLYHKNQSDDFTWLSEIKKNYVFLYHNMQTDDIIWLSEIKKMFFDITRVIGGAVILDISSS